MSETETSRGWITTRSGQKVHILNPRPEEIHLEDIAWHLSHANRWCGALSVPYSVAAHSLLVASEVPDHLQAAALLHDAAEAYLGDWPRPLKQDYSPAASALRAIEGNMERVIGERFGLTLSPMHPKIKEADTRALITELRSLHPAYQQSEKARAEWGAAWEGIEPFSPHVFSSLGLLGDPRRIYCQFMSQAERLLSK